MRCRWPSVTSRWWGKRRELPALAHRLAIGRRALQCLARHLVPEMLALFCFVEGPQDISFAAMKQVDPSADRRQVVAQVMRQHRLVGQLEAEALADLLAEIDVEADIFAGILGVDRLIARRVRIDGVDERLAFPGRIFCLQRRTTRRRRLGLRRRLRQFQLGPRRRSWWRVSARCSW